MTIKEELNKNIPREVISTRSQSGVSLSYLETWYVIDRLNQVLGTENWNWLIQKLDPIPGDKMGFICHGVIQAIIDGKQVMKTGIGYGSDKGKFNPGEMASKEAESDALKRAAMKLGRSLGLALYDKSQEYVDEQDLQVKPETRQETPKTTAPAVQTPASTGTGVELDCTKKLSSETKTPTDNKKIIAEIRAELGTKILRTKIKAAFRKLESQKQITKEDFVSKFLGGGKVDTITDEQVLKTIEMLKTSFTELPL